MQKSKSWCWNKLWATILIATTSSQHVLYPLSNWSTTSCKTGHKALLIVCTAFKQTKKLDTQQQSHQLLLIQNFCRTICRELLTLWPATHHTLTEWHAPVHCYSKYQPFPICFPYNAWGNCCITTTRTQQQLTTLLINQRIISDHFAYNTTYHKHEEMAASEVSSAMSLHKLVASSSHAKAASQSACYEKV